MIKRPLSKQFNYPVLAGIKVTTIRENAWPLGVPIMLYNWAGKPYRSKHVDVAEIVVTWTHPIWIERKGDEIEFQLNEASPSPAVPDILRLHVLWSLEGFESPEHMQVWFRNKMREGTKIERVLNCFRLARNE